ncbi:helix-turn-helix domain-containing protein [Clostridium cellulovorans]|uniref:Transcriptional regulator, AraC family n=1 Tax=Clostridium cellulovorans (strain ATCC 35296 / DSM 3052 / OCM 3 / 743B) TaxID=573061 RepID=D9STR6_CLOC7|nr:helix-turn-helix domain-containing protein [Clostridium cellulovorans]ADL52800.1 transcriptional regulator, AraC family [Clostridium cellulovorans 743B]
MQFMYLYYFTNDNKFPFFIQYGQHKNGMGVHYHFDFSELVIVLNGTATHIVNNEQYVINKGDVFVINGGTWHSYENTCDFEICNIMYQPENLFNKSSDIERSYGYHALFVIEPFLRKECSFNSHLKLAFVDLEKVKRLIISMYDEYQSKIRGYQTLIWAYFMELVVFLSRRYTLNNMGEKENLVSIAKSISYIENHFKEQITLTELAEKANISIRHFNRIFNKTYKTTPMNYIMKLRMQHASLLLKESKLSISDIAFESGFNDSNYFTRKFRKHFGVTPKEYRSKSY